MLTYITGPKGKSLTAKGIADQLEKQGKEVFISHEGITEFQLKTKLKKYTDVIICWQKDIPLRMNSADIYINIITVSA